jgi:hypothetical protein
MVTKTSPGRPDWRPWTVWLPTALATAVCLFLGTIGWGLVGLFAAYNCSSIDDTFLPGCGAVGWWVAAGLGQWVLAAAGITLAVRSHSRPGLRPAAAISCWLAIPFAAGWFALCLMLWKVP